MQLVLKHRFKLHGSTHMQISSGTINAFSLLFLTASLITFFSSYFIVRIQFIVYITYKIYVE